MTEYLRVGEDAYWCNTGRYQRFNDPTYMFGPDPDPDLLATYRSVRLRYFELAEPSDDNTPVALVAQYPGGTRLGTHAHNSDVLFLVVTGMMYAAGGILRPGDAVYAKAHEFYGPFIVGADGAMIIEIFGAARGVNIEYRLPDGGVFNYDPFGAEPRPQSLGTEDLPALEAAAFADQSWQS